ncbi:hypothetical protein L873DRAFT_1826144 [Choiromyces venosus 120613-1]|uniref:Probable beta-glucosidase F n=1 Tax=Choiromyces venosus 120613-1 TaxID=1336337 RepID=A0A3N4KBX9_9PEZI|nr:hypothetical protein L873DRAFT_1826144 [Choiromyces venosus 120613-1]
MKFTIITTALLSASTAIAQYNCPPYYPAPRGGWVPSWSDSYTKAQALVSGMSLAAKDGPLGVRYADLITAFPAGITTGATWDKDLMYQRANAMGAEFRGKGIHVLLGPSGVGARESVKGIQDNGVQATIKHFIANEQGHYRGGDGFASNAISANVDDRTMHEVYLWPFAEGVRAGVASVMCSHNMLLNGILKDELGFQGFVMADWLAQRSGVGSALAGMDQSQPGDGNSWANGISLWGRELPSWYQLGQDTGYPELSFSSWTKADDDVMDKGANAGPTIRVNSHVNIQGSHAAIARAVARDSITLLKNTGNVLPLTTSDVIRVFASDACPNPGGMNSCTDRGCNQGVLGMGWGSGTADYPYLTTPIEAITGKASNVQSILTDPVTTQVTDMAKIASAKCLVFISSNSGEGYITVEGHSGDRNDFNPWHNGDALVQAVAGDCANTIVVIHSVGPINMEKFSDLANVKAIVLAHLPGQEAGSSLVDVLFGDYSPSGKLPYTIAKQPNDYGASADTIRSGSGAIQSTFTEGLYIGYKYFDKNSITPGYEFGFGLSYTTFSFSDLKITTTGAPTGLPPARSAKGAVPTYATTIPPASEAAWPAAITTRIAKYVYPYLDNPSTITSGSYPYPSGYSTTEHPAPAAGGDQGGNPALGDVIYTVTATITNTRSRTGKNTGFDTPIHQLRGFSKVEIADLSVWDVVRQNWVTPGAGAGGYTVWVGDSSRNLPLSCKTTGEHGTCGDYCGFFELLEC